MGVAGERYRFAEAEKTGMGSWVKRIRWREVGAKASEYEKVMGRWAGECVVCHLRGRQASHGVEVCPRKGKTWKMIDGKRERMRRAMVSKKCLESFAMCFGCMQPQGVCRGWKRKGENEFAQTGQGCQWPKVMLWLLATGEVLFKEEFLGMIGRMGRMVGEEGMDVGELRGKGLEEAEGVMRWMGRRRKYVGAEGSNMSLVGYELGRIYEERVLGDGGGCGGGL